MSREPEHAAGKFLKIALGTKQKVSLGSVFFLTSKGKHVWGDGGSGRVGDTVCFTQDRAEDTEVVLG